jgi:hypothetical protein
MTAGGRERTEADFQALYTKTGFELKRVIQTASPFCIVERVKI